MVCSHNLSPALSASSSGTGITILVHLAATGCVVYVVMENVFALISQRVLQDQSPVERLRGGRSCKPVNSENPFCVFVAEEVTSYFVSNRLDNSV